MFFCRYPDLATSDSPVVPTTVVESSALEHLRTLLSVHLKHLDADSEMRRFFGSKVINAAEASSSQSTNRGPIARSLLTRPKSSWPAAGLREGLSMRPLNSDELTSEANKTDNPFKMAGEKWFTIEHSPGYRFDQAQFIQVVGMLDPNNLFALMRESPWHCDTLLQIGEVYRQQDGALVSSNYLILLTP